MIQDARYIALLTLQRLLELAAALVLAIDVAVAHVLAGFDACSTDDAAIGDLNISVELALDVRRVEVWTAVDWDAVRWLCEWHANLLALGSMDRPGSRLQRRGAGAGDIALPALRGVGLEGARARVLAGGVEIALGLAEANTGLA